MVQLAASSNNCFANGQYRQSELTVFCGVPMDDSQQGSGMLVGHDFDHPDLTDSDEGTLITVARSYRKAVH